MAVLWDCQLSLVSREPWTWYWLGDLLEPKRPSSWVRCGGADVHLYAHPLPPPHTHTHTHHAHIQTGLANRVVPKGKSLEEALKVANQIAEFPQQCLRADRRSAYCAMYRSQGFLRSLGYEHRLGTLVLHEARAGARKFVEGMGRGGNFN